MFGVRRSSSFIFSLLLIATTAFAAAPASQPISVDSLVSQLDADEYQTREEALASLSRLPPDALPDVLAVLNRPNLPPGVRVPLRQTADQLRARSAFVQRRKVRLAWVEKLTCDSYESVGHHDPKWDADARRAIKLFANYLCGQGLDRALEPDLYAAAKAAIDAGCDDALVQYVHARAYAAHVNEDATEAARLVNAAATALKTSKYPPPLKLSALLRVGDTRDAADLLKAALAADPDVPTGVAVEFAARPVYLAGFPANKGVYEQMLTIVAGNKPEGVLPLLLRARWAAFCAAAAVDGKGGSDVIEQKDQNRISARQLFAQAWERNRRDPTAANDMLDFFVRAYSNHYGEFDDTGPVHARADEVETWFRRAMDADPDNYFACRQKLELLRPEYGGNARDMLAFGRECAAGKNFAARIPFILCDAHYLLSRGLYGSSGMPDPAYFKKPEVWADVSDVYEAYLKQFPQSTHDRSFYAKLACWAGQWAVADAQFKILGDRAKMSLFGPDESGGTSYRFQYELWKKQAAENAKGAKPE